MYGKIRMILIIVCGIISVNAFANTPEYYINAGRQNLFNGSLDGIRNAYEIFNNGMNDPQSRNNRELIFFHALTRTVMLAAKDNSGNVDSALELAKELGITTPYSNWAPLYIANYRDYFEIPENKRGLYEVPADAPDAQEMVNILKTSFIPEVNSIINELNSITETPSDRFRIYLTSDEMRIFYPADYLFEEPIEPVEVDYAEVLMLKGILSIVKAEMEFKTAYDLSVSADDKLFEKVYGGDLKINDILAAHPDILKVLPTINDSNNGKAILTQTKADLIYGIDYYLDVVQYMLNEEDEQEDDLFSIEPEDEFIADAIEKKLTILKKSLIEDTPAEEAIETTKTFHLYESANQIGEMHLEYGPTGFELDGGDITFDPSIMAWTWEVEWGGIVETGRIEIELRNYSGYYCEAYLEGDLSPDGNTITNATFEYWGYNDEWQWISGTLYNISAQTVNIETEDGQLDLNPVFGSARYPNPVNPRDILPEFDNLNGIQAGTIGSGLGNDATLGGIFPQATHHFWQTEYDLQPSGQVYLKRNNLPKMIDGSLDDWSEDEIVFHDITDDVEDDDPGFDIKNLYLAIDRDSLCGAIEVNGVSGIPIRYIILFSPVADAEEALNAFKFEIEVNGSTPDIYIYYQDYYSDGWAYWPRARFYPAGRRDCPCARARIRSRAAVHGLQADRREFRSPACRW
jgi:hypothetical protein